MSGWISVKEKLPLEIDRTIVCNSTKVLVTDGKDVDLVKFYQGYIGEAWGGDNISHEKITHWMPLPEPPKD